MKSIAFYNNKGGVGKTTSAINIAYELAKNSKVLIIDVDGQANCSRFFTEELKEGLDKALVNTEVSPEKGECIFRYIYNYVGCKKPFKRLWISSLTAESIRNGFNHLLPAAEKDNMFSAGITRAKIDWLWGMNMTRLYTKHFGALCSVGRVQTAVVNMIAERDNEIDHFTKKPYFKLKLDNGAEWFDDERESFPTRAEAERVKAKCENSPCKVVFVNAKQKKGNRPLLFSLTSLQVEANDKLGFSAATTLAVMQSLYEKKLLTYPRTDSNYLTEDMAAILEERVSMLRVMNEAADEVLAAGLTIDSRIINDSKVSDHHAIIPTENIGGAASMELSANEKAILDMVITRFLAALSPQYEYTETDYVFEVSGERFKCRTKAPRVLGWKRFYTDNDEENSTPLNFSEGFSFEAKNLTIDGEMQTQQYEDRNGNPAIWYDVAVDRVCFTGEPKKENGSNGGYNRSGGNGGYGNGGNSGYGSGGKRSYGNRQNSYGNNSYGKGQQYFDEPLPEDYPF